jgi:spore maturation protein CgeB
MKIIVAGAWGYHIYEEALHDAFIKLGLETYKFSWQKTESASDRKSFKYLIGPCIKKINKELLAEASRIKPDLIFIYRGTHIYPKTIKKLTQKNIKVFAYNNDDPFGASMNKWYWRHFTGSLKYYDYVFAYRQKNVNDYLKHGAKYSSVLRSYFIEALNFHVAAEKENDIAFIGHFEDDGRDKLLENLINNGINLKLYGTDWEKSSVYNKLLNGNEEIKPVRGKEYNELINKTKILLVFLSKKNNDTYTRRCFEIPAAKSFMLCEYTEDLDSMFNEGREAEYFRNGDELLEKAKYYLENESEREKIAESGYQKLLAVGHEVKDRAEQILKVYQQLR